MAVREGTGADGGVAGARNRVEVRVGAADEPGAIARQPLEAGGEVGAVPIQVVAAHLIDHEQDDELRRRCRGLGLDPGSRRRMQRPGRAASVHSAASRRTRSGRTVVVIVSGSGSSTGLRCRRRTPHSRSGTTAARCVSGSQPGRWATSMIACAANASARTVSACRGSRIRVLAAMTRKPTAKAMSRPTPRVCSAATAKPM